MSTFPVAGFGAVAHLLGSLAAASWRGQERVTVLDRWVRRECAGSEGVIVDLVLTRVLLVVGPRSSAQVLADPPSSHGFVTGSLKRKGMSFLAPRALTISDGADWVARRRFNETVLCTGRTHDLGEVILGHVNDAFNTPLDSTADVHDRMAEVMTKVVVGGGAPATLSSDVDVLIGVAESPVRRAVLGRWHARRRRRFYTELDRCWREAPDETLVGRARGVGDASGELIEQVPHWMFTFTGSATDLLSQTLAIVASRPAVRARIADEVRACGTLDDARTIDALDYTEACLRETGRLFPPVTKAFHQASDGCELDGREVPAGIEVVHYFPICSRDPGDVTAHDFRPERWIGDHAPTSNLFLSGARRCPGEDLILFICKAALARASAGVAAGTPRLALDPLPSSFPVTSVT